MRASLRNAALSLTTLALGMLALAGGCADIVGIGPLSTGGGATTGGTGAQGGTGAGTTSMTGGSGGSGATTSTGGGGSISQGEAYAASQCGHLFECCKVSELPEASNSLTGDGGTFVDYAGCRIWNRTLWDGGVAPIFAESVAAGRMEIDAAALAECFQTLAEWPCSAPTPGLGGLCGGALIPKVAVGGTCTHELECISGTCVLSNGKGTCEAKPAPGGLGEPCGGGSYCEAMLYCEGGMCASVKVDGQPCYDDQECQSGTCAGEQQGTGMCATICQGGGPGVGPTDEVLETLGLSIAEAECDQIFNCCEPDERAFLLFSSALPKSQCLSFHAFYQASGLVQLHNAAIDGKASIDGAKVAACVEKLAGATCPAFADGMDFTCPDGIKGLVPDGQTCTSDVECAGTYCNEQQGKCQPLPGANAVCSADCAAGLYCNGQICVAQKPLGQTCTLDNQCAEGRCYATAGNPKVCTVICDGL